MCVFTHVTTRGPGGMPPPPPLPREFWNSEAILRPFLGQNDAPWRPDDRVRKVVGRLGIYSFTLFTAILQVSTCHLPMRAVCVRAHAVCMRALRGCPPSSSTKQAMSEGKSGPVETRLT